MMTAADPVAPLRDALEKDAFALFCQPVVALEDGAPAMAEILIRLREEEHAMLPPGEFLPLFEESGMMPQLDRWVVRHVVRHLARGSKIPRLSINVSSQTIYDTGFAPAVKEQLAAHKVAPTALQFEIEESVLMARPDPVARFAAALKALGCAVIIDGFGEAASGGAIKALLPQLVKVHGGIVRTLLTHDASADKLDAMARFCRALNIEMIADCVEDRNVLTGLKALGVRYAQGFGIQTPRPIETIAK
jgi:EAL domain-containing protein (putative c-di-GMP-specific phosphodiesterase class I)